MKLFLCKISEFEDFAGFELLPPQRLERLERYRRPKDKLRCLVAGLLLNYTLGERAKDIRTDENGKPFLPGGASFNLSHSGDYVALAVDESAVGVDIEKETAFNEGVARRCYTDDELRWLLEQEDKTAAFFALWTGKESIMKATGLGFSLSPKGFCVLPCADKKPVICGGEWYLHRERLDGYALCTASRSDEKPVLLRLGRTDILKEAKGDTI